MGIVLAFPYTPCIPSELGSTVHQVTTRKRLHEHITPALDALAQRLASSSEAPEWRELVASWRASAHHYVDVELSTGQTRGGRIDTRSGRATAYLNIGDGQARVQLCSVRLRDLVDVNGRRLDHQADVRTLLLQQGIGVPDSPAGITEP
jgi:hypothetical protein